MKRILSLTAGAVLVAATFASPAAAQLVNFPVTASPHGVSGSARGVTIAGLYGRGLNDNSGKLDSFGGAAILTVGRIAIKAGVMSVTDANPATAEAEIGYAGQVEVGILGSGPVAISAFVGLGALNNVITRNIPFGAAIGISPALSGGTTLEIWGAARGQSAKIDATGAESEIGFGGSGGVRLTLPMGLGFGAFIDVLSIDRFNLGSKSSETLFGGAVAYTFAIGG